MTKLTAADELRDQLNSNGQAVVAVHRAWEVGGRLLMAEQRKCTTAADSSHFLAIADALPVATDRNTNSRAGTAGAAQASAE